MQDRVFRPALTRAGEGKVASPDTVADWVREAKPGARCVYASGPFLPHSIVADLARRLAARGKAHLTQARSDAGFDYLMQIADPERAKLTIAQKAAAEERRAEISLLAEVEAYLAAAAMPPSVFGLKAVSDAKLVWRLKNGLNVKRGEQDAVRKWMAAHPPPETIAASTARKAVG